MKQIIEESRIDLTGPPDNARTVGSARRLARAAGFDETDQFLIASAASELATNILRYAEQGQIALRIVRDGSRSGVEMVARDAGPGIFDIGTAMLENYSSGNGLGLGLPSVQRIMDEFGIRSEQRRGTVVQATKWKK